MTVQKTSAELYEQYKTKMQQIADVRNAAAVLGWDQETYLPEKGAAFRGQQLTTLSSLAHELFTRDDLGSLLQELQQRNDLTAIQQRNVTLSLEDYEKNKKYPAPFVADLSNATNTAYHAWIRARKEKNYAVFEPALEKMVALKQQETSILGYTGHPYDALLNEYEKGADVAMLDAIFRDVRGSLLPLLQKIALQDLPERKFLSRHYPKDQQWEFGLGLLKDMGYDFQAGRQDVSEHPFTTSFNPQDVRVTTRIDEQDLGNMTWSCIHEGGHALYEQGLPIEEYGLPCGEAASLGIHESQSRLWENNVGRSLIFWQHHYGKLQAIFRSNLLAVPIQDFYRAINMVQPSLIRTEADELTYHFHVMIRYEIEKELIAGNLKTGELRDVWNKYYEDFLQVKVTDDLNGILQDIHWSHGSFGYFPTYSLGSFYAAQLFAAAKTQVPGVENDIASGVYDKLLHWLREKIHRHGRFWTSNELCEKVTGEKLDFRYFLEYATEKFGGIYKL
ncbi:carboxypeptidase M32 [Chitinophaga sp. GCM10012297]|uniref:Metal-dependent carboxypeptidase n=1 Tax=Chitinophaga chungangae TaxID=2821488 RepID=A0ABS3Y7R7_9BACT|nr:carboxypeptidase M32 [Chitinophaga chungangae]MBO9150719.1 carboxypeptidase M32 [Chitinophaga chungangae]